MEYRYTILILTLPLALLSAGCEQKGCTDKNALNYNSLANRDDGSCLFCEKEHLERATVELSIVDNNYSSQYFNSTVARVHILQVSNSYNFSSCGQEECKIYFEIENLINKRMTFYYSLWGSGQIFFNTNTKFADIQAYQTTNNDSVQASGSFGNFCEPLSSGQIFIDLGSYITYY